MGIIVFIIELTKIGSKVEDLLTSLVKMLEEDMQKEKELLVGLIFTCHNMT